MKRSFKHPLNNYKPKTGDLLMPIRTDVKWTEDDKHRIHHRKPVKEDEGNNSTTIIIVAYKRDDRLDRGKLNEMKLS